MNGVKSARATATLSMARQLFDIVREVAVEENRTTSNMMAVLVREGLEARGILKKRGRSADEPVEA